MGGDAGGDTGALLVSARPGHQGDTEGERPPSPTVRSV